MLRVIFFLKAKDTTKQLTYGIKMVPNMVRKAWKLITAGSLKLSFLENISKKLTWTTKKCQNKQCIINGSTGTKIFRKNFNKLVKNTNANDTALPREKIANGKFF